MTAVALAVLIPTRNRASLAIRAIESLLDRQECELEVFVSDNSSSDDERRRLEESCARRAHPRLTYLRPPAPLQMSEHWDWALRETLARSRATHAAIHYDRKVTKRGHLGMLARVAARHPDRLITYSIDFVTHVPPPLRLWQPLWSGHTYRIRTGRVIALASEGRIDELGQAWPLLSNCIVPRTVFESIAARFGDFCVSVTPDSCFAFRFCVLHEDYLHFDRATGINYANDRSAGLGYLRGTGGDFGDFRASWGDRPWLGLAPIPGLDLGPNMLFHEYERVRRETGDRLPPILMENALRALAAGLVYIADPDTKAQMQALLAQHGWRENVGRASARPPGADGRAEARPTLRERSHRWLALFLARWLGIAPETLSGFSFRDDDEALRYALRFSRKRTDANPALDVLEPVLVEEAR